MDALVALAILALIIGGTVLALRAIGNHARRDGDPLVAAERTLRDAEKDHGRRCAEAEKALKRARKPRKLAAVYTDWPEKFTLYDTEIKTPKGTHDLAESVRAIADTAGNVSVAMSHSNRMSATRIGVGGLLAGPIGAAIGAASPKSVKNEKTVDKRELFLGVEGDDWHILKRCNPDKGEAVRNFAMAVNVAARQADRVRAERAAEVVDLERRLASVRAETETVDSARAEVERRCTGAPTN